MATGVVGSVLDKQPWLDGLSDAVQPLIKQAFMSGGEAGKTAKDLLNGVWLGHPLHPVITDVPIGTWTMAQIFDVLSLLRGDDESLDAAADLTLGVGVIAAVGAALTGLADWSDSNGLQRKLGMAHAVLNVGGLSLNLVSLALRGSGKARGVARLLSLSGYATSALAAYVAGELVYGLGMAINRDAWVEGPDRFTDALAVADLRSDTMVKGEVEGRPVVLVQHDDGIHAFEGTCPHFGCGLWEGQLQGHTVTCACHGSQFDVRDGSLIHGPATSPVPSYEVRKYGGQVQVKLRK